MKYGYGKKIFDVEELMKLWDSIPDDKIESDKSFTASFKCKSRGFTTINEGNFELCNDKDCEPCMMFRKSLKDQFKLDKDEK